MPKTIIDERGVVIVPGTGVEINLPVTFSQTASFDSTVDESGDAVYDGDYTFSGTVDFAGETEFAQTASFDAPAEFNDNVTISFANIQDADVNGSLRSTQGLAGIPTSLNNPGLVGPLNPGVYTLDAVGPTTASLVDPFTIPGAEYVFLTTQAQDHVITSSAVAYNTLANGQTDKIGTRVTTPGDVYDSIVLKSDGYRYLILGASGSYALDGAV